MSVLLNQGSAKPGSFSPSVSYPALAGTSLSTISAGDFNGDGALSLPQLTKARTTSGNNSFATGDFNRDGLTDLAYLEPNSQSVASSFQILFGDPSGQFVTGPNLALDPTIDYRSIVPFQNTSTSNITNFALTGNVTSIALNDGSGGLSLGESYSASTMAIA